MLVLRFLALVFFLVAAIALIADVTPLIDGTGPPTVSSLLEHGEKLAPDTLTGAKAAVSRLTAPAVWNVIAAAADAAPTFALFGALAGLCGYLGRRRHSIRVFTN